MYILEINTKRRMFYTPFDLFKEKKFHLIEGTMNLFENLLGQKWKKPLNILKKGFYKQILDYHWPLKILCHTYCVEARRGLFGT
jgi:hypothetical protein